MTLAVQVPTVRPWRCRAPVSKSYKAGKAGVAKVSIHGQTEWREGGPKLAVPESGRKVRNRRYLAIGAPTIHN
jgi:hypothetical protein